MSDKSRNTPKNKKVTPSKTVTKLPDFFKKIEEKNNIKKAESVKTNASITESHSPSRKRKYLENDSSIETAKKICTSPKPSTSQSRSPLRLINVSQKTTPEKSKLKTTPRKVKLFQRTPEKVQNFSVDVIEKFVTITPSKSNSDVEERLTPCKSGRVKTSPIGYISPSTSSRSVEAQRMNEKTPIKETSFSHSIPNVSKVKTKLNFSNTAGNSSDSGIKLLSQPTESDNMLSQNTLDEFLLAEFLEEEFVSDGIASNTKDLTKYSLNFSESQHCKIISVEKNLMFLKLMVKSTKDKEVGVCILKDFWLNCKLAVGDIIHIMAKKIGAEWIVDNHNGLVIYEPDFLVPSTTVVSSLFCKRRSVLKEIYKGFEPANEFMVLGTLTHSLLQETLKRKLKTIEEIEKVLQDLLSSKDTVRRLYESDQNVETIKTKISIYVPRILEFVEIYSHDAKNKSRKRNSECWKGRIDTVEDIEENIWCPKLGIKGKVDVTVKSGNQVMPLELKTGRATFSLEHKGQILLYIMMMNKLGYNVSSGLLLYLKDGIIKELTVSENEKRDILILRNELAYFLKKEQKLIRTPDNLSISEMELPEPINHHSACSKCPYNTICTTFIRHSTNDFSQNKPLQKVAETAQSHLGEQHINYFIHWTSLLNVERQAEMVNVKSTQDIYRFLPIEREKQGKCISNLTITDISEEFNGFMNHTFVKKDGPINFLGCGIEEGNYLYISTDSRPAIVSGFATAINNSSITVSIDRNLRKKYPYEYFHLDFCNSSVSNLFSQTSLALILEPTSQAQKLREIIIDKKQATFLSKLPKCVATKGIKILKRLNKIQQRAVLKSLSSKDYFLIRGMPGTGKTSTIVALIQLLYELGKTVLITSHTNKAVDNVCEKLQHCNIDFLRLGSHAKISDSLKAYSEYERTQNCKTPEQLANIYNEAKIVASTCISTSHPLFSKRVFDVCVVDESTQVLQPYIFKPIYTSKSFILIGDPEQLPPVVKNPDAREMGMDETMFDRLRNDTSTISLTLNYRMNKTITELANKLTYKGDLLVANETVANATITIPDKKSFLSNPKWILKALDGRLDHSVQLIDTGPIWNRDDKVEWSILKDNDENRIKTVNIHEAAIIFNLINAMLKCGICASSIGVVASFNNQVKQLLTILDRNVEVNTVDQYQGRDKKILVYSASKSIDVTKADEVSKFEILEDHRRLNVALTRAKVKLLVIGDFTTLKRYKPFLKLYECVQSFQKIELKSNVDDFNWDYVLNSVSK